MKLEAADLALLAEIAVEAATAAAELIARSRPQQVSHKPGGAGLAAQVVTEIDHQSEELLLDALRPTLNRFDLGLLTEERSDDGSRFEKDYFWSIDPLDGTLPFVEGRSGSAVSIALVERDGTPRIGVIGDPTTSSVVHAVSGAGAFRDSAPWTAEEDAGGEVLSVFADRSLLVGDRATIISDGLDRAGQALGLLGATIDATSGAVQNACRALAHRPGCYVKLPVPVGGGSLWDFAATACLFHEYGAVATDFHGQRLDLNRIDSTFLGHRGVLFATDEAVAAHVRFALGGEFERQ